MTTTPPHPALLPPAAPCYRAWNWPVFTHHDQLWLSLRLDPLAVAIPTPLAGQVTRILTTRGRPPAVLAHPHAPAHPVLPAGHRAETALPWPPTVRRLTAALLLPPSSTPRGLVTWLHPPGPDTLRSCREVDLFAALRAALPDPLGPP